MGLSNDGVMIASREGGARVVATGLRIILMAVKDVESPRLQTNGFNSSKIKFSVLLATITSYQSIVLYITEAI